MGPRGITRPAGSAWGEKRKRAPGRDGEEGQRKGVSVAGPSYPGAIGRGSAIGAAKGMRPGETGNARPDFGKRFLKVSE